MANGDDKNKKVTPDLEVELTKIHESFKEQKDVSKKIDEKIQNQDKTIDSIKEEISKKIETFEIEFNESISVQNQILSEFKTLIQKIEEPEGYIKSIFNSIKDGNKQNGWKYIRLVSIMVGILIILIVFTSIFGPNKYRDGIDGIDTNSVYKIRLYDSIFDKNVNKEIDNEMKIFSGLKKQTHKDSIEFKNDLIARIDKRYDKYTLENEEEKNQLIKNVTIINLVGRYTVILSCIIAFVLVLRAFAGSKKKDDIFEY
jgi:hypothetical protein